MMEKRQRQVKQSMPLQVDEFETPRRKHRYLADRMGRFSGVLDILLYPQGWLWLIAFCLRSIGRFLKAFTH
ncbi:hypothetical protein BBL07_22985 [Agrobacterium vitis]|nr:hypothetical protein BBL07_22985 [Agrobacterium vitis]